MTNRLTLPLNQSRRTEPATRAVIDPRDKLNAAVVAYNMRQGGREYPMSETTALLDAVKQFNARRFAGR